MSDDVLMARFFASYVSPSERSRVQAISAVSEVVVALRIEPESHAAPVLPEGWRWHDEDRAYYGRAAGPHYRLVHWNREDSQLIYLGCEAGEFPEVERYVLWKNGVQS